MNNTLNAKGKGEYSYDYNNDIMIFRIKNRDYSHSIDFGNIITDIDKKGFITGLRIFDASSFFDIAKIALNNIKGFEFTTKVEDKIVNIQLKFMAVLRNKPVIRQGQNFVREALNTNIIDSKVICTI